MGVYVSDVREAVRNRHGFKTDRRRAADEDRAVVTTRRFSIRLVYRSASTSPCGPCAATRVMRWTAGRERRINEW